MIRMSMVPPVAFGKRYAELNAAFGIQGRFEVEGSYSAFYSNPLGPFYTALTIDQTTLGGRLDLLSEQPIRELTINYCRPSDPDLAVILRNYRTSTMFYITLNIGYRNGRPGDVDALAKALKDIQAPLLHRITIVGVTDPKKLLQVFFMMNRHIPKGCQLFMGHYSNVTSLVRTK